MKRRALLPFLPLSMLATDPVLAANTAEEPLTLQKAPGQQTANKTEVLHDIQGPVPTSDYPPYLMEAAIVLLVLVLLGLLFFFLKRRKKPQSPPLPPWDKALMELDAARQLMCSGESLLYLDQASQILRRYIELRFALRSTRRTTREFFASLSDSGPSALLDYRLELQTCLERADMAKFAHLAADEGYMQQMEEAVRTFITRTIPEIQPQGGRP